MQTHTVDRADAGAHPFARRRPVTTFLIIALGFGLPLLGFAAIAGLPQEPFLLVTCYVGLAGGALLVSRWVDGPGAAVRLLRRLVRWRFGLAHWLTILLGMPALTLAVAAATGTLQHPAKGWGYEVGAYAFLVVVFGGVVLNLWEELGWTGFVQARLMDRHGILVGSLLTAVPFAALHIPRAFTEGWTASSAAIDLIAIAGLAPVLRYLLGLLYVDTAGSLLAVGLMHASFNASAALGAVNGGWQYLPALAVLTAAVALTRRRRGSRTAQRFE
jgi:membrane protease YdiL (CAAX protease family)